MRHAVYYWDAQIDKLKRYSLLLDAETVITVVVERESKEGEITTRCRKRFTLGKRVRSYAEVIEIEEAKTRKKKKHV